MIFSSLESRTIVLKQPGTTVLLKHVLPKYLIVIYYPLDSSPCNGDSGGGYMVFVPDISSDVSPYAPGSYYIRGIVSVAASRNDEAICDPTQYTVYTDVARYILWIKSYVTDMDE